MRDDSVSNGDAPHYDQSGYTDDSDSEDEISNALRSHKVFHTTLRSTVVSDQDIRLWDLSGNVAKARRLRGEHANLLVGP